MTVILGHASIDERGKAAGGAAGDQTGKEVCKRDWYAKGWDLLLRPKRGEVAERSASACEAACENPNIGYDQGGRNTLYAKAAALGFDLAAVGKSECDCSSLMHVCAIAGGANLTYDGNGLTTRTMASAFAASKDYEKLTDDKFLNSAAHLRRGDILVKEGSHTAMVLSAAAEGSELRLPCLGWGDQGDTVKAMQQLLSARGYEITADGIFGSKTEDALRQFQVSMNLPSARRCDKDTWSALLGLTGAG